MPDFRTLVEAHLAKLSVEALSREEITDEVVAHLSEVFEQHCANGESPERAVELALAQVRNWPEFCREVVRAKENKVTSRVKTVIVPGLVVFILAVICDRCLILAGVYRHLRFVNAGSLLAQLPWYLSLPFCGAIGAFLARRAGGNVRSQFTAVLYSPLLLGLIMSAVALIYLVFAFVTPGGHWERWGILVNVLLSFIITDVIIPALALALGVIPFMHKKSTSSVCA